MKLRVMSDLHLNFGFFEVPKGPADAETVLVLAGDVCEVEFGKSQYLDFFKDVTDRFRAVLYVFGNHEYYGSSYLRAYDKFMNTCGHLDRLKVMEEDAVDLDGVRFLGTTLWTDMDKSNPLTMRAAKEYMNDYNAVRTGTLDKPYSRRLQPEDTVRDHYVMREWLLNSVVQARLDGYKPVVVTHHHPSEQSVQENFKFNALNPCFYSDLHDEVFDNGPDLWCCGHMHTYIDYMVNKTRVLCNPRGYHSKHGIEKTGFNPNLVVEV